jgi:threonine aldolase
MIGNKDRVANARVWRKRYGAGMRQIGLLAAAGHYALDHNIERLAEDHRKAKLLANACNSIAPSTVNPAEIETNIVGLDLDGSTWSAAEFADAAKKEGLWVSALGPKYVRLVTHLDVSDQAIKSAIEILKKLLERAFVAK